MMSGMKQITLFVCVFALLLLPLHASDEEKPPPPNPPKATGELSDGEKLFQGEWRLGAGGNDDFLGKLEIDGRDFRHEGVHGKHSGYVTIRADKEPAEIDFTIEDCGGCNHQGKTSAGIYQRDGGVLIFNGPVPGDPRPQDFSNPHDLWRMRLWDDAAEEDEKQRTAGG
jgi:uncharacterized protein (TIGR03067 family)